VEAQDVPYSKSLAIFRCLALREYNVFMTEAICDSPNTRLYPNLLAWTQRAKVASGGCSLQISLGTQVFPA
jgi:hypothetical protein